MKKCGLRDILGRSKLVHEGMDVVMGGCEELRLECLGERHRGVGLWYGEALRARMWAKKYFQLKGGGAHGYKGNYRGPELGSSVDCSGKEVSREAKRGVELVCGIVVQEEFVGEDLVCRDRGEEQGKYVYLEVLAR